MGGDGAGCVGHARVGLWRGASGEEEGEEGEELFHWWVVAGGWWLVAGEVVDLAYPVGREFFVVAVEGVESKFADALRVLTPAFWFVLWGEAFPVFWKLVVFCCLKTACSFAASVRAARAQPPLVMPLSEARRVIS
jgi:hypothetical protein